MEGASMQDDYGIFNTDTSQIKKLLFGSEDEINEEILEDYFHQAIEINKSKKRNFLKSGKR